MAVPTVDLDEGATLQAADAEGLARRIKEEAIRIGFDAVGIALLGRSDHAALYRAWLEAGYNGEMHYLSRSDAVAKRSDPAAGWPGLRSAIVLAQNYGQPAESSEVDASQGIVARYARGRDYHRVIKPKLLQLLRFIESLLDRELSLARAYVDTGPVFERELARRAGLGWFGRNTMLIHPRRGSYFFLGTLLLEIDLVPDTPFAADHCGSCRACLDACPTGALLGRNADGAPVIDARRCISYLTIEQRGPIPRELRPLIGNHIFGCDICQEVCPWNEGRGARARARAEAHSDEDGLAPGRASLHSANASLIELMQMDEAQWDGFSRGRAIRRAKRAGFLRNVAVALGNWGAPEAVHALITALSDTEPLVREHAAWALGRIGSAEARTALTSRLAVESDESVIQELRLALAD